jgi:hypothetical protein
VDTEKAGETIITRMPDVHLAGNRFPFGHITTSSGGPRPSLRV